MKTLPFHLILLSLFFIACNSSSEPTAKKETATLTIFYSNDFTGYLTPCG
jgi:hypothetical protein